MTPEQANVVKPKNSFENCGYSVNKDRGDAAQRSRILFKEPAIRGFNTIAQRD